jgi:uncharacterized coiled-coil protein SlyX
MAKSSDWLPSTHSEKITMARNWVTILKEGTPTNASKWTVPDQSVTDLENLTTKAEEVFAEDQDMETKTQVVTAKLNVAIRNLVEKMRDIKKRFFYIPPLTEDDLVALGLKIPDSTPTKTGDPTSECTIEYWLKGQHEIGIKIVFLTGSAEDKANKGFRVWYTVLDTKEPAPTNPDNLHKSFFTKKHKDIIVLDFEDSGKRFTAPSKWKTKAKRDRGVL